MEWYVILLVFLLVPVILFPAAFLWYFNIGGFFAAFKEVRKRKSASKGKTKPDVPWFGVPESRELQRHLEAPPKKDQDEDLATGAGIERR
jgi:hypothetical protein